MLSVAGPIADVVILRGLLADRPLRVGQVLAARVLDRQGPRGTLLLNGVRVGAQLPAELAEGDALRVRVTESAGERVVLQVVPQSTPTTPPPSAYALGLPGGVRAWAHVDEDEGAGAEGAADPRRTAVVRLDSPVLGRLEMVLDLDTGAITGTVHTSAGDPAARARDAAADLEAALAGATGRPAIVTVREREETLDVRA